jgi:hypothetical protein
MAVITATWGQQRRSPTHQTVEAESTLSLSRDGILGHQFNIRLESFSLCFSKSLLLADNKKLFFGFKNPYKKIREPRKAKFFMNSILLNGKTRVENKTKTRV